jgi:hypothetical protein
MDTMRIIKEVISQYEENQFNEIVKWEQKVPSVVSMVLNTALKPVTMLVQAVIPSKAIKGALVASNWLAESLTDSKDIKRDGKVNTIKELQYKDLELSDKLANVVHNWANGIATAEGGAVGLAGLPGMVADIPALITLSLRTIHKIGLCYGYECKTEADKRFVYGILSAAGANTVEEKTISVATLQAMSVTISKMTWKKMSEKAMSNKYGIEAAILTIKALAKQLGINITKRKAAQAIPVIGAGVGAAMNLAFINDVSWAARREFQKRWLYDNKKIM